MCNKRILVVNYSMPQLNHLAAGLAETGALNGYVRPYANQNRVWERAVAKIPGMNDLYRHTFGRRVLPHGLSSRYIYEGAIAADMVSAISRGFLGLHGKKISDRLHWHIQKRIADIAVEHTKDVNATVASYLVAKPVFQRTSGLRILDYPIAHHRFIQRFVAEEARREPEFACTFLPDWNSAPPWVMPRLDAECDMADVILVGSQFVRDTFIAEGIPAHKLVVIPYGTNVNTFHSNDNTREKNDDIFRILFVGQINHRKGISYLLRAYSGFQDANTKLTLIGNYNGDASAFMPYQHLFDHIPHIPYSMLAEHYREANVFIFPSLIEGLPLVVIEAMASGLPVITTPCGADDIVRDGIDGFVVPIRDANAIVEKLKYLRDNPDVRLEMGQNARQRALEFTWEIYRKRTTETLMGLL